MQKLGYGVPPNANKDFLQRNFTWLCIAIICLGFWLRVSSPHVSSFWLDEVLSVNRASSATWEEFLQRTSSSGHGPIYEWFILRPWLSLGANEYYTRFPGALLGTVNLVMVFVIGRRFFGYKIAVLSGLIFAVSAFQVEYTQEARPYVLASLMIAVSLFFFMRIFCEKYNYSGVYVQHFIGYGVFASLALYSHYTVAFMLLILALYGYGYAVFVQDGKLLRVWSIVQILILFSFLPWLGMFLRQYESQPYAWISSQSLKTQLQFIPQVYWHPLVFDWTIIYVLCGSVIVAILLALTMSSKQKLSTATSNKWLCLGAAAWGPVFVGIVLSLLWHPFFVFRYFLYVVTPAALFMGGILISLLVRQKLIGVVLIIVVVVSMTLSAYRWTRTDWKEDWRGLAQYLENTSSDNVVILSYRHFLPPFNHYYQGSMSVYAVGASVLDAEQVMADMKAYRYVWTVRGMPRFSPRADVWETIVRGLSNTPVYCEFFGMTHKLELCLYEHEP